jgi:hypothetical protein
MRQGIGGSCRTQGMHAETVHVCINLHHGIVTLHNVLVDRIRMQVLRQYLRASA